MDKLIQKVIDTKAELLKLEKQLRDKEKVLYPTKVFAQEITEKYSMYLGDCINVIKGIPDNSIHYSIFSPPFLSLFIYSDNISDMGNCKNDEEFYRHFSYLIPELYRVLKSGRLISVHTSIVPETITHDGRIGIRDFPGEVVRLFKKFGFIYHSKVMIWKDPLIQAVRTKTLTLAHKQISKDSSRSAQGFADEILTFRKPGVNEIPITHGRGFENYIGEMPEPTQAKNDSAKINKYSHNVWQRYASPVWWDIDQTKTLNYRIAKDENDEKHVCPLQLQTIARCLELWTNPGEIVLSPFAGVGSEGYEAIKRDRKFIGPEVRLLWKQHLKQALSKLDEKIPDYSKDNDLVEIIEDEKEIIKKLKWLYKSQNKFAFDIETTGIKPHDTSKHQIHVISFAYSSTGVFSIPLFPYKEKVIKYLKILLESKSGKIAQNMKFENKWMRIILGIHVNNWVWDTMLATHILDNKTGVTGLKFQTYVQCGIIGYEKDIQPYLITKDSKSANAVNKMEEAMNTPKIRKQMLLYCGLDSLYTFRIAEKQMEVLTWK